MGTLADLARTFEANVCRTLRLASSGRGSRIASNASMPTATGSFETASQSLRTYPSSSAATKSIANSKPKQGIAPRTPPWGAEEKTNKSAGEQRQNGRPRKLRGRDPSWLEPT
jgi:hypothetical protein